ncbi:PIN domain-containing protein [Uliginosibacterium sp. H1]|uniref:PIN domain-containing protein n=1 Tax=Uliginosibacterium sp. H1 TaxID=3114757 RepID=UPI002E17229C|nr:PIN domain-containing protein [Uliginosibacterium sp. H1]
MRPRRWVLDTNVVMALWHFRDPKLAVLKTWLDEGRALALTRADCLDEFGRVLAYSQFGIEATDRQLLLADYTARAQCWPDATPEEQAFAATLPRCRDRDDQKFIALAWDAGAEVLVTRDRLVLGMARKAPLRDRFTILTPEKLVAAITPEDTSAN